MVSVWEVARSLHKHAIQRASVLGIKVSTKVSANSIILEAALPKVFHVHHLYHFFFPKTEKTTSHFWNIRKLPMSQ